MSRSLLISLTLFLIELVSSNRTSRYITNSTCFNSQSTTRHPYDGTVLNDIVSFRWKPNKRSWQFSMDADRQKMITAPPPILKMFDLLLWPCTSRPFSITQNKPFPPGNPRTVLAYPELPLLREAFRYLKLNRLEHNQRRSLVLAGEDSGNSMQRTLQNIVITS